MRIVTRCMGLPALLLAAMAAYPAAAQETASAATLDYHKLKAVLPERVDSLKRTSATGGRSSAFGISVAYAEAEYQGKDGSQVTIKLSDLGGLPGVAAVASHAWNAMEMESESDTGFERTRQYKGCKVMEQYDRNERSGEISLMVGSRISVEITGSNVDFETLQSALEALPLTRLKELASGQ